MNELATLTGTWPRGFNRDTTFTWPLVRAGQMVALNYGKALLDKNRIAGSIPVFGTNGQCGWHNQSLSNGPGLILGRKGMGNLGVKWCPSDFWVIDTAYFVTPNVETLDMKFLYYLIGYVGLNHLKDGTSNPSLSRYTFYAQLLPNPPLKHQQAIAQILGTLDDKIELSRRMNRTLEGLARGLFQSWFVDFDPVRGKAAGQTPSGLAPHVAKLFPDAFEDSELGKKPQGWYVEKLEEALDVLETGSRPKGGVRGVTSGVPSVGAESIVSIGRFDFQKTKYVPVEFFRNMRKGHVQSRDVLIYKDGGRPGVYEPHVSMFGDGFPFDEFCINEHVYRLRANRRTTQNYLYFWLTSATAMEEMRVKGTGVAIPGLNSTAVKSLSVLVPPADTVRQFDANIEPVVARLFVNCRESKTLAGLRDALLPKLISGELRVPDAERIVGRVT